SPRPTRSSSGGSRSWTTRLATQAPARTAEPRRAAVPAVSLRGIRRSFGEVVAIRELDLDIAEGEFFTLLGPSGSGKTTTLRVIAGFEQPDAGRVELAGVDVTRVAPAERDVNTVFQDYALFPHMTVEENVEYGLRVKGGARTRCSSACGCPVSARAGPSSSRAGSGSASRSHARSSTRRRCSSWTSRWARST